MKNKKSLFILLGMILLAGCATTNHSYFQTGKPSGKNNGENSVSLCAGSALDYEITDEIGSPPVIELGNTIKMAPLLMFQYQGGATNHVDGGFALGISFISFNLRAFSKICLLTKNPKFGIALSP